MSEPSLSQTHVTISAAAVESDDNLIPFPQLVGAAPARSTLSDLGNAERFVAQHGDDLRYCPAWGTWLFWDGQRWRRDETGEAMRRAKETARNIYKEAADLTDSSARQATADWAKKSESEARLRAMIRLAETEPGITVTPDQFDTDPWLLNVANGTIDLRTGDLREHRREDLLTKLAPIEYDTSAQCPTWLAFLDRIFDGNTELIAFIQRAVGYSLTGDTSEQVLFLLHGTGANGKSTLLESLRAFLGDYAQATDFRTLQVQDRGSGPRPDLARMKGARFISAVEPDQGRQLSTATIKQLTGGDTIAPRGLYQDHTEFQITGKLWLAANHKPTIPDASHGTWRRIQLVPFSVTIPDYEQDKHLAEKLRAELTGVLVWAVQGCLAWQRDGLGVPPAVRGATDAYKAESDTAGRFLDERCYQGPVAKVASSKLYRAYMRWCHDNGEQPISQRELRQQLLQRGFQEPTKLHGVMTWRGLGVEDQDDE
jgi:putative DNA primase/helicase